MKPLERYWFGDVALARPYLLLRMVLVLSGVRHLAQHDARGREVRRRRVQRRALPLVRRLRAELRLLRGRAGVHRRAGAEPGALPASPDRHRAHRHGLHARLVVQPARLGPLPLPAFALPRVLRVLSDAERAGGVLAVRASAAGKRGGVRALLRHDGHRLLLRGGLGCGARGVVLAADGLLRRVPAGEHARPRRASGDSAACAHAGGRTAHVSLGDTAGRLAARVHDGHCARRVFADPVGARVRPRADPAGARPARRGRDGARRPRRARVSGVLPFAVRLGGRADAEHVRRPARCEDRLQLDRHRDAGGDGDGSSISRRAGGRFGAWPACSPAALRSW